MSNHTPGPWIYDEVTAAVCTPDGVAITTVKIQEPPEAGDEPVTRANGHLIAAVPKLLKALEFAKEHLEWVGWGDRHERQCAIDDGLVELIDEALSEAKGKPHANP